MNPAVWAALIAAVVSVGGSLAVALVTRPKTNAEAKQLNTSASVAISQEIREWAQKFIDDAKEANDEAREANSRAREADGHSRDAETHAQQAEERATQAEERAQKCDERYTELETLAIKAYGHIRRLNDTIKAMGGTPPALPPELEAVWNGQV